MLFAVDYSNMFLTNERPNPYSEQAEDNAQAKDKNKDKSKEEHKEDRTDRVLAGLNEKSTLLYQAQFGFENQSGFDNNGYGLIFSAIKPLPNFFRNNDGAFIQGDFLYTVKELQNASGQTRDYIALTAFGGYAHKVGLKTVLTVRGGGSFVTGSGKFEVAYGMGVKRDLKDKRYKLVGNWLIIGDLTVYSLGAEFSF